MLVVDGNEANGAFVREQACWHEGMRGNEHSIGRGGDRTPLRRAQAAIRRSPAARFSTCREWPEPRSRDGDLRSAQRDPDGRADFDEAAAPDPGTFRVADADQALPPYLNC